MASKYSSFRIDLIFKGAFCKESKREVTKVVFPLKYCRKSTQCIHFPWEREREMSITGCFHIQINPRVASFLKDSRISTQNEGTKSMFSSNSITKNGRPGTHIFQGWPGKNIISWKVWVIFLSPELSSLCKSRSVSAISSPCYVGLWYEIKHFRAQISREIILFSYLQFNTGILS